MKSLPLFIFSTAPLCLHNVSPFVLKHVLKASGIISFWSVRPFHGFVWLERLSESVEEIIIRQGQNRRNEREASVRGRAQGFALTHTQHHSLYINPYLIRLSCSALFLLVYFSCVVL